MREGSMSPYVPSVFLVSLGFEYHVERGRVAFPSPLTTAELVPL